MNESLKKQLSYVLESKETRQLIIETSLGKSMETTLITFLEEPTITESVDNITNNNGLFLPHGCTSYTLNFTIYVYDKFSDLVGGTQYNIEIVFFSKINDLNKEFFDLITPVQATFKDLIFNIEVQKSIYLDNYELFKERFNKIENNKFSKFLQIFNEKSKVEPNVDINFKLVKDTKTFMESTEKYIVTLVSDSACITRIEEIFLNSNFYVKLNNSYLKEISPLLSKLKNKDIGKMDFLIKTGDSAITPISGYYIEENKVIQPIIIFTNDQETNSEILVTYK